MSQNPFMAVLADDSSLGFANQLAAGLGFSHADPVIGSPADAAQLIAARGTSPLYILIDIAGRGDDVLPEIDALAEQCVEGTRVVVLGETNDVTFYRALRQRGVLEYFTKPADLGDLRSVFVFDAAQAGGEQGKVITFVNAASGDGASTLAVNTAFAIAQEYRARTVIVDMDYQFGMVARNLDLAAPYGIRDLFEHPDRGIDSTLLQRMLANYRDSMHVIAAPSELRTIPPISPELVRELISVLRQQFDYIILDLPHLWAHWTSSALNSSNKVVVVGQLWLRSVTQSLRLLDAWEKVGVKRDQVQVVINRHGAKFREALSPQDFERVCGRKISFYIDNDIRTVTEAENRGITLLELGPSHISDQLRELASMLVDKPQKAAAAPEARSRPLLPFLKG